MTRWADATKQMIEDVTLRHAGPSSLNRVMVALERHFIVLEGLEVSADEMGVYNATGKTDAVTSTTLKEKAAKWLQEAEAVSQGERDTAGGEVQDALSFESLTIALEAESEKGFFRRIWDAISRVLKAIWDFVVDFFTGSSSKAERIESQAANIEVRLTEAMHQKPSVEKVPVSSTYARMFLAADEKVKTAHDAVELMERTTYVFEAVIKSYMPMLDTVAQDLKSTLKLAFEANFKDNNKNSDLYRALAVFDPMKIADGIGSTEPTDKIGDPGLTLGTDALKLEARTTKFLIGGRKLEFYAPKKGFFDKFAKPATKIAELTSSGIALIKAQSSNISHAAGEISVMDVSTIKYMIASARAAVKLATEQSEAIKKFHGYQKELDKIVEDCLTDAENNPEKYSRESALVLQKIASVVANRLRPLMVLQNFVLQAATETMVLSNEHLKVYK